MESLIGGAVCHTGKRTGHGASCGLARVVLTGFVPAESFSPLSLKLQCPLPAVIPHCSPRGPSVTQHPLGAYPGRLGI